MGMAILPARLLTEMKDLEKAILAGDDLRKDPALEKHADWAEEFMKRYDITEDNIAEIIRLEMGKVRQQEQDRERRHRRLRDH